MLSSIERELRNVIEIVCSQVCVDMISALAFFVYDWLSKSIVPLIKVIEEEIESRTEAKAAQEREAKRKGARVVSVL